MYMNRHVRRIKLMFKWAVVSSTNGCIGAIPDSKGVATVSSYWNINGFLEIGGDEFGPGGTGILDIIISYIKGVKDALA